MTHRQGQTPREASVALLEELADKHPEVHRGELATFLMVFTNSARNTVKQVLYAHRDPKPEETIDEMKVVDLMRETLIGWDTSQVQDAVSHVVELSRGDDIEMTKFLYSLTDVWTEKRLSEISKTN